VPREQYPGAISVRSVPNREAHRGEDAKVERLESARMGVWHDCEHEDSSNLARSPPQHLSLSGRSDPEHPRKAYYGGAEVREVRQTEASGEVLPSFAVPLHSRNDTRGAPPR